MKFCKFQNDHHLIFNSIKIRRGFTLIELLIVVSILGILAALTVPSIQNHVQKSKESSAKENLQSLRTAIERYSMDHGDIPPGYPDDDRSRTPNFIQFVRDLVKVENYLSEIPENPLNNFNTATVLSDDKDFPANANGLTGWIYKPATKEIKLNYAGTDSEGKSYYGY